MEWLKDKCFNGLLAWRLTIIIVCTAKFSLNQVIRKMMQPELAIKTKGLRKVFDNLVAVDSIDLDIAAGSITALLGGNGAGKTTTMAMLLGLLSRLLAP